MISDSFPKRYDSVRGSSGHSEKTQAGRRPQGCASAMPQSKKIKMRVEDQGPAQTSRGLARFLI